MKRVLSKIFDKIAENKGFLIFLLMMFTIRWSFADHYRVPTGSMLPTIELGDHVFVNKMAYDLKLPFTNMILKKMGDPKRGEIVTFKYPLDPSVKYVKRLIAVPGDKVEIRDGIVAVNGKITLNNPSDYERDLMKLYKGSGNFDYTEKIGGKKFTIHRTPTHFRPEHLTFIVPKDKYFVMGDNRDLSSDGRYWGFVPRENFIGRISRVTIAVPIKNWIPSVNFHRFGKELI